MSDLLDQAVAGLRTLSPERQEEVAEWLMQWAADDLPPLILSDEDERSFAASLDEAARCDFVADEAIQALWLKHRF